MRQVSWTHHLFTAPGPDGAPALPYDRARAGRGILTAPELTGRNVAGISAYDVQQSGGVIRVDKVVLPVLE